jgi:hypoxanthine phosphoribosyltransferase
MEFIYLCAFLSVGSLIAIAIMHYTDHRKKNNREVISHA